MKKKGIVHLYRLKGHTDNDFVDDNFQQSFAHLHFEDEEGKKVTYLIRALTYRGHKIDFDEDAEEVLNLCEWMENEMDKNDLEHLRQYIKDVVGSDDVVFCSQSESEE